MSQRSVLSATGRNFFFFFFGEIEAESSDFGPVSATFCDALSSGAKSWSATLTCGSDK